MKRKSNKKIFFLLGSFLFVLLIAAAAVLIWIDSGLVKVKGIVLGPEGERMRGLEVQLCTYDHDGKMQAVLARGRTNLFGRFRLRLDIEEKIDEAILSISDGQGEGRILVKDILEDIELQIDYPIVETVVLLHDNDLHFNFNQIDRFKAKVDQLRESYNDVYLFNAGDIFVRNRKQWIDYDGQQKDYQWYGERCLFMVETMNEIGYDAMTVGNHDLVLYEHYTGTALKAAGFPILAANVKIITDLAAPKVLPYVFFTTSTYRKLGVLGLTSDLGKKAGLELDPFETAEKYLSLADQCDIFIGLTHMGDEAVDAKLAETFPEFDVFITGGSHIVLEKGKMLNDTLLAQAGGNDESLSTEYPKYLGMVVLTLENGKIVGKDAQVIVF